MTGISCNRTVIGCLWRKSTNFMDPRLWEELKEGSRGGSACHNVSNDRYTTTGGRPGENDFPFTNCCLKVD